MKSSVFPPLFILLAAILISGCTSHYAVVERDSLGFIQQCLDTQQTQQQQLMTQQEQLMAQQQQFSQAASALADALGRPLRLNATFTRDNALFNCPTDNRQTLSQNALPNDKQLIGAVETVAFPQLNIQTSARIDTGAKTSSLDARNVEVFERDGKEWVRFDIPVRETGNAIQVEQKVVRWVRINQSTTDKAERRATIRLQIQLGGTSQEAEFNLADRENLGYTLLIGRNVLKDLMIVDVSKEHLTSLPNETGR